MEFSILQVSINGHLEGLPGGSVYRCLALRYGGDLLFSSRSASCQFFVLSGRRYRTPFTVSSMWYHLPRL